MLKTTVVNQSKDNFSKRKLNLKNLRTKNFATTVNSPNRLDFLKVITD